MIYSNVIEGTFLSRPNRFIAMADIKGNSVPCHVKNTGRLGELLIPGKTKIYLTDHGETVKRKTRYSLISVEADGQYVNIDSQAPNRVVWEWLAAGSPVPGSGGCLFREITYLKPEQRYHSSRFDFYLEADGSRIYMEVKGVTLRQNGIGRFPDAPTLRGLRHIEELCRCRKEGYEAYLLFIIQMEGVTRFEPNDTAQAAFRQALREAASAGVHILALDCLAGPDRLSIHGMIPAEF